MQYDVVFSDVTAYKPYSSLTLRTQALGGTEATVVRVAEGLANIGLKVAVVQRIRQTLESDKAFYLPESYLDQMQPPGVFVMLRGISHVEKFPRSKLFSWQHDAPDARLSTMTKTFINHNVKVLGVSKWHKNAIKSLICDPNEINNPQVSYIYNPVPEELYIAPSRTVYHDPNKLVWLSSPHKGLDKALFLFDRLKEVSGNKDYKLHVYNPGYMHRELEARSDIIVQGAKPCNQVWNEIQNALCVFYPSMYEETFGLIAAEANALHVPVAAYELAGICETAAPRHLLIPRNDEKRFIDTVIRWSRGERPEVYGNSKFKTEEVIKKWIRVICA